MARFSWTGTIMASFCVCSSALYTHAFSAYLPAMDGRDGKPLPQQRLQVFTGELQADLFSHPQSPGITTDERGRATQVAQVPKQTASPPSEQVPTSQQTPAPQQTRTSRQAKRFRGLPGFAIVLGTLGVVVLVVFVLPL